MQARTIVYSGLGNLMEVFDLDAGGTRLALVQSLTMPAIIQDAWPNRARTALYVATSEAGPMVKVKRPIHFVQAFRILPSGALEANGEAVRLDNRPLSIALDREEAHVLLAYNDPPDVTVHRIAPDGSVGEEIAHGPLDFGPTVHQVRLTPPGNIVVVPACAHHETGLDAGSVGLYSYRAGQLAPLARMVADPARAAAWQGVRYGAHGFAARHVDFHPTRPWMYLCVERQGEIRLYDYDENGITLEPRVIRSTLEGTPPARSVQLASGIHVHPNGRFIYVSNRAWDTEPFAGKPTFVGGTNDVAVFAIDAGSGEPTLIQHADTLGIFPRTFGIDAEGKFLVAANEEPGFFRDGDAVRRVVPSLVVFRIGEDGRLTLVHKHDHPDNGQVCFWVGVVSLPAA